MTVLAQSLRGKRVLITQADEFMGPALCEGFTAHGAIVIADRHQDLDAATVSRVVEGAGHVDVLIANLAIAAPSSLATEATDEEWRSVFARLVDPLPRLCRAVLPQMTQRSAGKIIVMGSAAALRGNCTEAHCIITEQ